MWNMYYNPAPLSHEAYQQYRPVLLVKIRVLLDREVLSLRRPLGQSVKVATGPLARLARVLILGPLEHEGAVGCAHDELPQHVNAVHRVIVGRVLDGIVGVLPELDGLGPQHALQDRKMSVRVFSSWDMFRNFLEQRTSFLPSSGADEKRRRGRWTVMGRPCP